MNDKLAKEVALSFSEEVPDRCADHDPWCVHEIGRLARLLQKEIHDAVARREAEILEWARDNSGPAFWVADDGFAAQVTDVNALAAFLKEEK